MYKRKAIKILALVLALSCLFGCTGKESGNTTSDEKTSVSQETTTQPTTTEPNTTEESTTEEEKTTEESTSKVEEKTTEKSTEIDIQPVTEKEVTTTKKETTTEKEVTTTKKEEPTTEKKVTYTKKKETVYAKSEVNIRKSASTNSKIVGVLKKGNKITRTATGDNGWSKVTYNGDTCYIYSSYLTTTKPVEETTKKKEETTTKKEESTKKNNNTGKVVAKTDGGIELKEITSKEAEKIAEKYYITSKGLYEGTDATGKKFLFTKNMIVVGLGMMQQVPYMMSMVL